MASGVASPWGYSPKMAIGTDKNLLDNNGTQLFGQLAMNSAPVTFDQGNFISPLKSSVGTDTIGSVNRTIRYLMSLKD